MREFFYEYKGMDKQEYILIFGGGASRGISYIGAIKALNELNVCSDKIVGSSVGSIFAVLYALDYDVETLKEIFYDFNAFIFKDINFGIGADFAFSKGDIFENWIRELIEKKFYGENYKKGENPPVTFKDLKKDLYVCTTDLAANKKYIFSKINTPDDEIAKAVRISSSFPGLMKPVITDDKFLVDGDLAKSLPLWDGIVDLPKDVRILEFRLEGCKDCMNCKTVIDYFNTVYSSMSNFSTENILKTYNNNDMFDYILIDTKDVLLLDFQMSNEMKDKLAENGYQTTKKYFTETLPEKRKKLLPLYEKTLKTLEETKNFLKDGKNAAIKEVLAEYIFEICTEYNKLDANFMQKMEKFKTDLLKDIYKTPILPITTIKNKTAHIKVVQGLIEDCENKVQTMKKFIENYR